MVAYFVLAKAETKTLMAATMMFRGIGKVIAVPAFALGCFCLGLREHFAFADILSSCGSLDFTLAPLFGRGFYQPKPDIPYLFAF